MDEIRATDGCRASSVAPVRRIIPVFTGLLLLLGAGLAVESFPGLQVGISSGAESAFRRAGELFHVAETETDWNRKLAILCESLASVGDAVEMRPFESRYLVSWASMRQLLGEYDCSLPRTDGDFRSVLESGINHDPSDPGVLYEGAKVYLWAGEREKGLSVFRRALKYGIHFNTVQEKYILSQLFTADDLREVLPPVFPQIAEWSALISAHRPDMMKRYSAVLDEMQIAALASATRAYGDRSIPEYVLAGHLTSLYALRQLDTEVRREADKAAALLPSLNASARGYFAFRAGLRDVPVLRGFNRGERRPLRSVLAGWNTDEKICADDRNGAVGFFLPDGESVEMVELRVPRRLPDAGRNLRLYVSGDNQEWHPISVDPQEVSAEGTGQNMISVRVPSLVHRYWKIHFEEAGKSPGLCGHHSQLVRVYAAGQ